MILKKTWYLIPPLIITAVIIICYLFGVTGSLYYDDLKPLGKLKDVSDINSALYYVMSETSGPLGRPIAMITFLFNQGDWPTNIISFFHFNIILHAINGLLVFGLSYFIFQLYQGKRPQNYWLALATCAFWLVLPMQVSTSLIAIQRMAGLSAFFVFFGLLLYVIGLNKQNSDFVSNNKSTSGLLLQLIGLIAFTLLAMFTKENGILLPVFVFVLEVTLLRNVEGINYRRRLRTLSCALGLVIILIYILYFMIKNGDTLAGRNFTLTERLMTQPQVLIDYLRLSFFPDVTAFNPFHDNYRAVKELLPSTKAMYSLIIIILGFGFAVIYRKKHPIYCFAIFWFLSAHLLESTALNLELYFEHRNYVALLGPCLALVYTVTKVPLKYKKLALIFLMAYWLILVFTLQLTTKTWGEPQYASQVWYNEQVGSERAAGHLSFQQMQKQNYKKAAEILQKQLGSCHDCINLYIQTLTAYCLANDKNNTQKINNETLALINDHPVYRAPPVLPLTYKSIENGTCLYISIKDLKTINNELLLQGNLKVKERQPILFNLYQLAELEGNTESATALLRQVWSESKHLKVASLLIDRLLQQGNYIQALSFVQNKMCHNLPVNPILKKNTLSMCSKEIDKITKIMSQKVATQ